MAKTNSNKNLISRRKDLKILECNFGFFYFSLISFAAFQNFLISHGKSVFQAKLAKFLQIFERTFFMKISSCQN